MRDNALYFPYINVPHSAWFTRILLYWDRVSSIVPSDYIYHPERLSPYMRELLVAGLVEQVIPGQYVDEIHAFEEVFLHYIDNQARKRQYNQQTELKYNNPPVPIHLEKVGNIGNELIDRGLAKHKEYPWYDVDAWVANSFMAYLAAILGQLEPINAAPITNSNNCFSALGGVPHMRQEDFVLHRKQDPLRTIILRNLLPSPAGLVSINDIVSFKAKYGDSLQGFRRRIETACIELTNIQDLVAQQERVMLMLAEFEAEIEEITDAMRSRWKSIVFYGLCPLIGAGVTVLTTKPFTPASGVVVGSSLATAVYQALDAVEQYHNILNRPLAYAAFFRTKFGEHKSLRPPSVHTAV